LALESLDLGPTGGTTQVFSWFLHSKVSDCRCQRLNFWSSSVEWAIARNYCEILDFGGSVKFEILQKPPLNLL
jgi:hypothetical protein